VTGASARVSPQGPGPVESTEFSVQLYRCMVRIRRFEEHVRRLFLSGEDGLRGPVHLCIGQEAVSAGVIAALTPVDAVLSTYRGHGQVIAAGAAPAAAFAEILGKATGLCRGKGGSMHLASVENGHFGCNAIVGAHLPIAAGMALASRMQGRDQVVACFFGDGAANIGAFHEALNLAALWSLPVLFVCENNQYMEHSRGADLTSVGRPVADRAASYGLPGHVVDGNDVQAVHLLASECAAAARDGAGPAVVEAQTYRHYGHSLLDSGKYRSTEEIECWKARDPLPRQRAVLESRGVTSAELDRIEGATDREMADALAEAREQPPAEPSNLLTDLWADGGATWRS
jgi:pyruvate dehydrogenase E1 component alpha subunit